MPGFLVTDGEFDSGKDQSVLSRDHTSAYTIVWSEADRYNPERGLSVGDRWTTLTNGVVLNSAQLALPGTTLASWAAQKLNLGEGDYYTAFRGSFSGGHFDAHADEWTFYTNHIGDQPIYYFSSGSTFAVGSDLGAVRAHLHTSGVRSAPRETAVAALLTYGFLIPGETINDQIRRLEPGQQLCREVDGKLTLRSYHAFSRPETLSISLDDAAAEVDRLFERAVSLEFDHDRTHGREHLADLSGGMDARMVSWVARDLGYSPVTNITYSQSGYHGLSHTQAIAAALGNHLMVSLLDDVGFLFEAETAIAQNHASALYSGITGGRRMLEALDWNTFGLEHTGQLGDLVIGGSYLQGPSYRPVTEPKGLYSKRLAHRLPSEHLTRYEDEELYAFHVRGLNGALSTHLMRQHYTQVVSPFLDLNLVDFCFALPPELRAGNRLYRHWVSHFRKPAGEIPNDNSGAPLNAGKLRTNTHRLMLAAPRKLAARMPTLTQLSRRASMNPFAYWYATNPDLRSYLDTTFRSEVSASELDSSLIEAAEALFKAGTPVEKTMSITALVGARLFG